MNGGGFRPQRPPRAEAGEGLSFEHVGWNWLGDVCVSSRAHMCESEVRRGSWPRNTDCGVVQVGTAARWTWVWTEWPKGSL